MSFAAAIFDLDGTLLDTLEDIADSANRVLARLNLPQHPLASYRYFVGNGVRVLFERALPTQEVTTAKLDECVRLFDEEYGEAGWNVKTSPYDGILQMIADLRKKQIPLAVLSNKPHPFTLQCVDAHFDSGTFASVLGQRPEVPKKPDAAGAIEILNGLGIPAEQVAYVGDTDVDMQTAINAGFHAVAVTWGFRPVEELKTAGAQTVLESPADLLALFK